MSICFIRCLILFSATIALEPLESLAQLGQTKAGEYWIGVRSIRRSGDARDLNANLGLIILKRDLDGAERLHSLKVIRAEDDTGQDLVRFRKSTDDSPPHRMPGGFFTTVVLKSPATNARRIKILECEGQLVSGTNRAKATTLRFVVEDIRLPWVDPADVEVAVTPASGVNDINGKDQTTHLSLTFSGGTITNSSGIRRLTINRAETESGELLRMTRTNDATSLLMKDAPGRGRIIDKSVVLGTPLGRPRQLKALTGQAELWQPSRANGGIVELNEFLTQANHPRADETLNRIGVKLKFLGRDSFETRMKEWKDKRATFTTVMPPTPLSSQTNSLLLSLDDPEHRVVSLEFLDDRGERLPELTLTISTATLDPYFEQLRLYTFETPPPDRTGLRVYLATPESLQRITFDAKNVALP